MRHENSRDLKQLINYLRFQVKPRRPGNKAYRLYMAYWGAFSHPELLTNQPLETVH